MEHLHTDPLLSITEGFFDRQRNGEILPPGKTNAKDITPVEEPTQVSLKELVQLYNSADLTTQIDFVKLLTTHDRDKIQYALKGTV